MSLEARLRTPEFLTGGGGCAELIAARDWSTTPMGPIDVWPQSLRTATAILLRSPVPMVMLWGPDGVMLYNDAYSAFAGGRHPQLLGSKVREGWPEVADFNDNVMRVGLAGGTLAYRDQELTLYRHGRPEQVFMNLDYSPVIDEHGQPAGVLAIVVETTERVAAARQLQENEARLAFLDRLGFATASLADADAMLATTTRLLGEHLKLSVCAYADMDENQDGFTIRGDWAAPGSKSIVGHYSLADFGVLAVEKLGAGLPLVINDNLRELAPDEAATFQDIGIASTICMPLVKEGRLTALMAVHDRVPRVWTEAELLLLGEVTARSWAHVERVAAAAEVRTSEGRLRAVFDQSAAGFARTDLFGRFEEVNDRYCDMVGRTRAELLTLRMQDLTHPNDLRANVTLFERTLNGGSPFEIEKRYVRPDGSTIWVRNSVSSVCREGKVEGTVAVSVDISDRRRAEDRLQELNETLEHQVAMRTAERDRIWQLPRDLMCVARTDGTLVAVNPAWERLLGWPSEWLVGRNAAEIKHPDDSERTLAELGRLSAGQSTQGFEDRYRAKNGNWHWISWTIEPEGDLIYCVGRDVTAEKAREAELLSAQEALRQSQKLESMGQLTGGVAHDFNNLLTPIIGSLDMMQRRGIGGEREQRLIDGALQSAERAKTLVQRLLAFARRQPLQPVAVELGKLVEGMADLVASTLGPRVRVEVEVAPGVPPVTADPNQLEMAILNLAVNARDAMPDGGRLTIAADAEAVHSGHSSDLPPGPYVRLSVSDTGVGMDDATLQRAVEPFFSTKGVGKGTGLGLSMVHGLAAQLAGTMMIASRPGLGTTVSLWLPVATASMPVVEGRLAAVEMAVAGTVLLVDDEELVRASTADMLVELGYSVIEAATAEQALRMLDDGLAPAIIVTDHLMPGMTGVELERTVRERHGRANVLVISGYAEDDGITPDLPRLTKPFRQVDLAAKLAELEQAG